MSSVVVAIVMIGIAYLIYVRLYRVPRAVIVRHAAAVAGGACGVALGALGAVVAPSGPYAVRALPLALGVIGGLVLWWRTRDAALGGAAAVFALVCTLTLLLDLGAA